MVILVKFLGKSLSGNLLLRPNDQGKNVTSCFEQSIELLGTCKRGEIFTEGFALNLMIAIFKIVREFHNDLYHK